MVAPEKQDRTELSLTAKSLIADLASQANAEYAATMQWFFKTGPGEYGEGDVFIGAKVPVVRLTAKPYRELDFKQLTELFASEIHENRLAAAVICSERAKRYAKKQQLAEAKAMYRFYLSQSDRINNWDLVDISCRDVVGLYLLAIDDVRPLCKLARSRNMWERRIAMVSTWSFIREGKLDITFELAELLIDDEHDLMHKATGWMLREAGKKDLAALERFLADHASNLPRTALRYSIERMTPERRAYWLAYKN